MVATFSKRKKDKSAKKVVNDVGLDDFLLGNNTEEAIESEPGILVLPASMFYVDEQVRKGIDQHEIEERAASMRSCGQIQPIVVHPANSDGKYKIDKGECRWRASQLIDDFLLMAIIDKEAPKRDKKKRIVGQLVENVQRSDLRTWDLSQALQELAHEGMSMEEIAKELGWLSPGGKPSVNKVSRILSIFKLPEEGQNLVKDRIVTDLITLEHLRKIYEIDEIKFGELCNLAREDGISRKQAEKEYAQCKNNTGQCNKDGSEINTNGKPSPSKEPSRIAPNPIIRVEWRGLKEGVLMFDKDAESQDSFWVKLDNGDEIIVELSDLTIKAIRKN